jgi:hypothetical protein
MLERIEKKRAVIYIQISSKKALGEKNKDNGLPKERES